MKKFEHNILNIKKKIHLFQQNNKRKNYYLLAKNFPALWNADSTSAKDRKRILRLLIKDITVEKLKRWRKAILHIRWQGGATERHRS